jgi:1,2-diacylglycerol 3-beta-glucosyltransferase
MPPPDVLREAQKWIPHLRVYRRQPGRGGGKSGALNEVLPLTQGEIILVCDADAVVPSDFLARTLPLFVQVGSLRSRFSRRTVGAVQVRKAPEQTPTSTSGLLGQVAEMASDAYFQQQRVAVRGYWRATWQRPTGAARCFGKVRRLERGHPHRRLGSHL